MLDKSVPYVNILMKRKAGVPAPEAKLPDGFRFVFFKAGDEKYWAEIEASVLEFGSGQSALEYFKESFLPHLPELERRCVFVENEKGGKVATGMAWWGSLGAKRHPWLHWIAVKPEAQGYGLGKAVSAKATQLLIETEGEADFYLSTQTWSHRAVGIYEKLGWEMTYIKNNRKYSRVNFEKAKKLLRKIKQAKR
jgi:ribosomal protein S18 acetylase RimI-like enzyme